MRTSRIDTRVIDSPLPPVLTGVLSLIIPGLGQVISNQIGRGLLMLASLVSIVGILITRLFDIADRFVVDTVSETISKAFEHFALFSVIMILTILAIYLWIAFDAYKLAKEKKKQNNLIFWVVLLSFFTLGIQLSEVNLVRFVTNFPTASRRLGAILWPWEAAFVFDQEVTEGVASIRISSEGEDPEPTPRVEGQAHIRLDPPSGTLASVDERYNQIPGSRITVFGTGFNPNTLTEIWWIDENGGEFRPRSDGAFVETTTDSNGDFEISMTLPFADVFIDVEGGQYNQVAARQSFETGPPRLADDVPLILSRMLETIFMGMMATIFGIILSIPVSFLAARNIMGGSWIGLTIYYLTRFILNVIRSIEPLIWAIVAVIWVGLGPFAGIIALTIHSVAALGKLYSEAIESIDQGPIEAIQATGANQLQTIIFAVIPQMISPFVSFSIYRWDINVRMSTIIGLVGGGGVGFLLIQYTRLLRYQEAGIAVWFIAITVAILDYVSAEIRNRFV